MWFGNSAKFRIINEISKFPDASILDFGAGTGRNWINILKKIPTLKVCLFEPDPVVYLQLKENLKEMGPNATIVDTLDGVDTFDFILSFSVFEHVSNPEN